MSKKEKLKIKIKVNKHFILCSALIFSCNILFSIYFIMNLQFLNFVYFTTLSCYLAAFIKIDDDVAAKKEELGDDWEEYFATIR